MLKVTSVLPPEMAGVMHITGYRGIGKTYLAAQADAPQNIVFMDFENKGEGLDSQLGFGLYRALTQESGDPSKLFETTVEVFKNLEQDRYTVAILDNISWLELALEAGARKNVRHYVEEYGLNLKNVLAGRFGGLKSVVNFLISDKVCGVLHGKGIQLIIVTSHIKERWGAGGPIPGKYRIKGADRWQELSVLTLVLIPGDFGRIPAAIVQKEQLGLIEWDETEGKHRIATRLPARIARCTFEEIRRYLKEPADLANPKPGEVPTPEEFSPFEERLSKEQIGLMTLALKQQEREERDADETVAFLQETEDVKEPEPDPIVLEILRLSDEKRPIMEIAKEVKRPLPYVKSVLNNTQGKA